MEHEIIGHTKKAYKVWRNPEKHLWEKAKEILIEILIIVFAVTFAAFIERSREHSKEKSEAKEFLLGLKGDLANERKQVNSSKLDMDTTRVNYATLVGLNTAGIDSFLKKSRPIGFNIPKFDTRLANGRYDGFKSSGKIQTIENDSLRNSILKLYEEDIPNLYFAETAFNANQARLEDLIINNSSKNTRSLSGALQLLTSDKSKILLTFSLGYSNAVVKEYMEIIKQVAKIDKQINKEYQ